MKKTLLSLSILFFLSISSKAQYYPLLEAVNHWTIVGNGLVVTPHQTGNKCNYPYFGLGFQSYDYVATDDTLINGLIYKIVRLYDHNFSFDCDFGYVREDTAQRKVYFVDNTFAPEILLYDFSLNVGDSMFTTITIPGSYFENGYYTLDSISTQNTMAGNRRVFNLSKHTNPWQYSMTWIEGVGCLEDPFYPYSSNFPGGFVSGCQGKYHSYIEYMSCFEHTSKMYYDSCAYANALQNFCFYVQDSCSYYDVCGSVKEMKDVKAFDLSPNPAHGETQINFEITASGNYEFAVLSETGQEIPLHIESGNLSAGKHQFKINTAGLSSGIYFVRCKNQYAQVFQKLIVM